MEHGGFPAERAIEVTLGDVRGAIPHDCVVIDVRFDEERDVWGDIPGAHTLLLSFLQRFCGHDPDPFCPEFSERDLLPQEYRELSTALIKYAQAGKRLFLVCRSGNRSLRAAELLRQLGYYHAYSLQGGLREWEKLLMPSCCAESTDAVTISGRATVSP